MNKTYDNLLKAAKLGQTYIETMNSNIAGAIGHSNTVIWPDLDFVNKAIVAAEKENE